MNDRLAIASGWYSAQDLAGLPGLPGTERGVLKAAKKNLWPMRGKARGKGFEYPLACLPAETQAALLTRHAAALPAAPESSPPAPAAFPAGAFPAVQPAAGLSMPTPSRDLTDRQRLERDARAGVIAALDRLQAATGCGQEAAMNALLVNARAGELEPHLDHLLRLARDPRGRAGDGYPSIRTLKRWLATPDLAPKVPRPDMGVPPWAPAFLRYWQQPQKPTVEAAYRDYTAGTAGPHPSIHQVRRLVGKLGTVTRERGRMGARELKNLQPFVRRDFSHLVPNDIWTADGHTFDAEVQHPLHGRPFRPEITTILDIATRRAVGWSVDLAESSLAVADALRYAAERAGVPAIFYVDNGSGYANAMLKAETTGLLGRLGTEIRHSLPYNSQARGVIERAHQTIWVQAARQLPSYVGHAMDREARLEQFKLTRRALARGGAMPLIPWDVFLRFAEARVAEYNARPHRTLRGTSPDLALRAFEARGWQADRVAAGDIDTLFRPRVTRTIARGEVALFTNLYFARALEEFHGMEAQIGYDIHDPSRVWVYTPEGRLICEAEANGNRRHYMPVPVIEQARERRAKGRLARVDAKRTEILEELHGAPALAAPAATQVVIGGRVIDTAALQAEPLEVQESVPKVQRAAAICPPAAPAPPVRSARTPAENWAEWQAIDAALQAGEAVPEADTRWHRSYQGSAQFRSMKKAAA